QQLGNAVVGGDVQVILLDSFDHLFLHVGLHFGQLLGILLRLCLLHILGADLLDFLLGRGEVLQLFIGDLCRGAVGAPLGGGGGGTPLGQGGAGQQGGQQGG